MGLDREILWVWVIAPEESVNSVNVRPSLSLWLSSENYNRIRYVLCFGIFLVEPCEFTEFGILAKRHRGLGKKSQGTHSLFKGSNLLLEAVMSQ